MTLMHEGFAVPARFAIPAQRTPRREATRELLEILPHLEGEERAAVVNEVVMINRGVADSIASRYYGRGVEDEDVDQVAREGLVKAVRRFDPTIRDDLLTFAVPTIRGEIKRHFRDLGWSVRPPRRIQELQQRVSPAQEQLEHELGRAPSPDEVAERLEVSRIEYDEALGAYGSFSLTSLDQAVGENGAALGSLLGTEDPGLSAAEARTVLAPLLKRLTERERRILHLRFFEDRTQAEIGEVLGVTQMQVSRLLSGILARLRDELQGTEAQGTQAQSEAQSRAA